MKEFQGISEAYQSSTLQESIFRSRLSGSENDSKPEELFLQNCDRSLFSSGVDSWSWKSRLVAWEQKYHGTWQNWFFFRSRLVVRKSRLVAWDQNSVQNCARKVFVQESTLDQGWVDSRPETRTFTEQSQKYTFFRSRLPRVTSRLGVSLTAITTIFLGSSKRGKGF